MSARDAAIILAYEEYMSTVKRKVFQIPSSKYSLRIAALEAAFKHWYVIGKAPTEACKDCGFPLLDSIHHDKAS